MVERSGSEADRHMPHTDSDVTDDEMDTLSSQLTWRMKVAQGKYSLGVNLGF
jgi:hypothetical protein